MLEGKQGVTKGIADIDTGALVLHNDSSFAVLVLKTWLACGENTAIQNIYCHCIQCQLHIKLQFRVFCHQDTNRSAAHAPGSLTHGSRATTKVNNRLPTSTAIPQRFSAAVSCCSILHHLLWPPLDGAISFTPQGCLTLAPWHPTDHCVGESGRAWCPK